jgi:putative transposase
MLRREGLVVNQKRTYRLYIEQGLQVRTKKRRKLPRRDRVAVQAPDRPVQCESRRQNGQRKRSDVLTVAE